MPIRIVSDDEDNVLGSGDNHATYVVQKGDTLSKIALEFYGDAKKYTVIYEANTDIIKDPNIIQVGWKLKIPNL